MFSSLCKRVAWWRRDCIRAAGTLPPDNRQRLLPIPLNMADHCAYHAGMDMTLGEMAKALNRSPLYLGGLQKRFELPVLKGAAYSKAYLAFLQAVIALRVLGIAEDTLVRLWKIERALLRLLHVDSTGSPTWFLDACGQATHPTRRLLLSNHDLGVEVPAKAVQLGLDFAEKREELFAGHEMGEDALRLLHTYLDLHTRIRAELQRELPHIRDAVSWAAALP